MGLVVSIGDDLSFIADAYATRTGRETVVQPRSGAVNWAGSEDVEIVFALAKDLTRPLIEKLASPQRRSVAGLFVGRPTNAFRAATLARAARAVHPKPLNERGEILSFIDLHEMTVPGRSALGRWASPKRIDEVMDASDLLFLLLHGDGIDASLSDELNICSIPKRQLEVRFHPDLLISPPTCTLTGHCFRLKQTLEQVQSLGLLRDPNGISAHIVLFAGCLSILEGDSPTNPNWGLVVSLCEADRIGALAAPWNRFFAEPLDFYSFLRDLESGMPIGEAIARFNRHAETISNFRSLCLLGDPATRFEMQRLSHYALPVVPRRTSMAAACYPDNTAFMRTLAAEVLDAEPPESQPASAARKVIKPNSLPLSELILDLCLSRRRLSDCWIGLTPSHIKRTVRCWICGRSAARFLASLVISEPERAVTFCTHCNQIGDMPTDIDLRALYKDGTLMIEGGLPSCDWIGGYAVHPKYPLVPIARPWPIDNEGTPIRKIELSLDNFLGSVDVFACFVYRERYAVAGHTVYLEARSPLLDEAQTQPV